MNWWAEDKIAGAIELLIALSVGYAVTILVAWLRTRRADNSGVRFLRFVRNNGWDASMLALVAIPSAALGGVIYGGVLLFVLDKMFHLKLTQTQRFGFVGITAGIVYLGLTIYIAIELFKQREPHSGA